MFHPKSPVSENAALSRFVRLVVILHLDAVVGVIPDAARRIQRIFASMY